MVRTQIQLTEEQASRLSRLAERQGVSKAALIRRSVDAMLAQEKNLDDAEVRSRAKSAAGRLHSGTGDLASRHDDYAAEAFAQ